jgi:DNA polymerase-3 subunit epsilon
MRGKALVLRPRYTKPKGNAEMKNTLNTTPTENDRWEEMAKTLGKKAGYRILRQLPKPFAIVADDILENRRIIALIDTETTGLDPDNDTIIELAIQLLAVGQNGEVIGYITPNSWLQDPGLPLDPKIFRITGLTDTDLAGRKIDIEKVTKLLKRADLIVAHNADFGTQFVEKLLPEIRLKEWACLCSEIDWLDLGYEGRSQNHLLLQHSWFATAHRAATDVWSLFWLLTQHRDRNGQTYLRTLISAADRSTVLVEATNAGYSKKEYLRARGYRWNPKRGVWWTIVECADRNAERDWLEHIGVPAPRFFNQTTAQRHRPR